MKNDSKYYYDGYGGRVPKQFFWFNLLVIPWIMFAAGWLDLLAGLGSITVWAIGTETLRRMLIHRGEIILGDYKFPVDKSKS